MNNITWLSILTLLYMSSLTYADITLSNSLISITFNDHNDISNLTTSDGNGMDFKVTSLWEASFIHMDNDRRLLHITSNSLHCEKRSSLLLSPLRLELYWIGLNVVDSIFNVTISVYLNEGSSLAHIDIAFESEANSLLALWEWKINSPIFNRNNVDTKVIENSGLGILHSCKSQLEACFPSFNHEYPQATFQFMSLYHTSIGLYIGAHDGHGYIKTFLHSSTTQTSMFSISAQPIEAGKPFTYIKSNFPVVIGLFQISESEDGWFTASEIYRNFVLHEASWISRGGPLAVRYDFPSWIDNVSLWMNSHWQGRDIFESKGGDPEVVLERLQNMINIFNISSGNLAFHWYEWDLLGYKDTLYTDCRSEINCGFDTHYPAYFPPREKFESVKNSLQELGIKVVPYINGRIFDVGISMWKDDDAILSASKHNDKLIFNPSVDDLDLYNEEYGSHAVQAVMCPHTSYWQYTISNTVNTLINSYSLDGVYIDQIASAGPASCFDDSHNHTTGGGNYWVTGYMNMLEEARYSIGSNAMIITEGNVESYMGDVNVYLSLSGFDGVLLGNKIIIPVFPAIYGGYMTLAGAEFYRADLDFNVNLFASKVAMMYIFGAILGWFSLGNGSDNMGLYEYFLMEKYKSEIDYVNQLSKHKIMNKRWLVYGRRVQDASVSTQSDEDILGKFPSILSAIWKELSISGEDLLITFTCVMSNPSCGEVSLAINLSTYYSTLSQISKVYDLFIMTPDAPDILLNTYYINEQIVINTDLKGRQIFSYRISPRFLS